MPTRQGGSWAKNASTLRRRSERRSTTVSCPSTPCTSNTVLAKSRPILITCVMDGPLQLDIAIAQLWHIDAVRGPSTPSSPGMTKEKRCASAAHRHAAIDPQHLAGDVGCVVGGEEGHRGSDLLRLAVAAHRHQA